MHDLLHLQHHISAVAQIQRAQRLAPALLRQVIRDGVSQLGQVFRCVIRAEVRTVAQQRAETHQIMLFERRLSVANLLPVEQRLASCNNKRPGQGRHVPVRLDGAPQQHRRAYNHHGHQQGVRLTQATFHGSAFVRIGS